MLLQGNNPELVELYKDFCTRLNTSFKKLQERDNVSIVGSLKGDTFKIVHSPRTNYSFENICSIFNALNLVKNVKLYNESDPNSTMDIDFELFSNAVNKLGYEKLLNAVFPQIETSEKIKIKQISHVLGIKDIEPDKHDIEFEGAQVEDSFENISSNFINYAENNKNLQFISPVIEGYKREGYKKYRSKDSIKELPEGLTPLPLAYRVDELKSHAVGLGMIKKGENYFLVYTNTGHASGNTGSFIFQIHSDKIKDLNDPSSPHSIEEFYNFYNRMVAGDSKHFYGDLMTGLEGFFLQDNQIKLINQKGKIAPQQKIDAQAYYKYQKAQKTGNCSVSNNKKQIECYEAFYYALEKIPSTETANIEAIREVLNKEGVENELEILYKDFTNNYLRNHTIDELISFVRLVHNNPDIRDAASINNTLQYLVAYYILQHDNSKNRDRVERLKSELNTIDVNFLKAVNKTISPQVYNEIYKLMFSEGSFFTKKKLLKNIENNEIDIHYRPRKEDDSILMMALLDSENDDLCELLLRKNAEVNLTCLNSAFQSGMPASIVNTIYNKIKIEDLPSLDKSPSIMVSALSYNQDKELVQKIINKFDKITNPEALYNAVEHQDLEMIEDVLKKFKEGINDPNAFKKAVSIALRKSVENNKVPVAKLLLKNGADIHYQESKEKTVLDILNKNKDKYKNKDKDKYKEMEDLLVEHLNKMNPPPPRHDGISPQDKITEKEPFLPIETPTPPLSQKQQTPPHLPPLESMLPPGPLRKDLSSPIVPPLPPKPEKLQEKIAALREKIGAAQQLDSCLNKDVNAEYVKHRVIVDNETNSNIRKRMTTMFTNISKSHINPERQNQVLRIKKTFDLLKDPTNPITSDPKNKAELAYYILHQIKKEIGDPRFESGLKKICNEYMKQIESINEKGRYSIDFDKIKKNEPVANSEKLVKILTEKLSLPKNNIKEPKNRYFKN